MPIRKAGVFMAHVQKFTAGSADRIIGHCEREKSEYGDFLKYRTTSDIDTSKTYLNMPMNFDDNLNAHERLKKRLSEVHVLHRKDVNVMCDWVLTYPQRLSKDIKHLKNFFNASATFLMDRYGRENVVSCNIHMDEAQPHMHFCFVPVVFDSKKEYYKVSAKEVLTRHELNTFHTDLENYLYKTIGLEKELVHSGITKAQGGNKPVKKLKQEKAQLEIEIDELKQDIQSYKTEKQELHDETLELERKRHRLKKIDLPEAEKRLSELQNAILSNESRLDDVSAEMGKKISENKNLEEIGGNLRQENQKLSEQNKKLSQQYKQKQAYLVMLASDIEKLPAFIEEWKERLSQITKDTLKNMVTRSSGEASSQPKSGTNKSPFSQPSFKSFQKGQYQERETMLRYQASFDYSEEPKKDRGKSR